MARRVGTVLGRSREAQARREIEIEEEIEIDWGTPLLPLCETLFLAFSVSSAPPW